MKALSNLKSGLMEKMPFQLRYYYAFYKMLNRRPRVLFPKDYRDYVFSANFFNKHKKHAFLADKYLARDYVKSKGLGEYLTTLYGVWDDASKIDFNALPNQFVIKCNHSADMNIIVYDKSKLDYEDARKKLDKWMHTKHDVFWERHYFYIKPMILCEELIPGNTPGAYPVDYKFHCASGKPVFIQYCTERSETSVGKRIVFSPSWERMPYTIENDFRHTDEIVEKPYNLNKMLEIASILSEDLEYSRIDLYEVDRVVDGVEEHKIYFGEITLTPQGGLLNYFTQEACDLMGKEIKERKKRKNK